MLQTNDIPTPDSQIIEIKNITISFRESGQVLLVNKRDNRTPEVIMLFQNNEQLRAFAGSITKAVKRLPN